jgi:hypothetical protein
MNKHLVNYINVKLDEAATYVIRYMPVDMTTNAIYENLIGEPHVVAAFREAIKYLPPASLNRRTIIKLGTQPLTVSLRLAPTKEYPVFLMPFYDLVVTQESELGQALGLAIQVTREWEMLTITWNHFKELVPDAGTLGFLFPWLREILLDFHVGLLDVNIKLKSDRERLEREVKAIHRRIVPKHFPRMSIELNQVCQSGKRLFGQYRMLEAAAANIDRAPLGIDRASNLAPAWLADHIEEALSDWLETLPTITRQDASYGTSNRRRKL